MAAARQLARDQHRLNVSTLESLDGRRSALQAALVAAQSALERAQADIDALEPELATIEKMRDVLIPEIQRQRTVFAHALLDTFPPELLRAIFLEAVCEPDANWPESIVLQDGTYNAARHALPFVISAVCSRWRSIATNVTALWAYIAVPSLTTGSHTIHSVYLERVKALLERSKQHPLDVMLDWRHHEGYTQSWYDCQHYQLIFDAVGLHVKRWRRVQLTLPEGVLSKHLAWLCERTPLLEDCSIVPTSLADSTIPWSDHLPRHLPYCPRLKRLCSTKMFVVPEHPLPLLSYLHIGVEQVSLGALWSLLRDTPSLQTLILQLPSEPIDATELPNAPLDLRGLTDLGLYGDITFLPPILTSISMPALNCLQIYSDAAEDLHLFRDTVVYEVSKLVLGQGEGPNLDGETALRLSALERVRELELTYCENILPEFFNELAAGGGLWPKLETVTIDGCELDEDAADAFLPFVQSRRNAREADSESMSPFRVTLTAVAMPAWLAAHIRARFGDAAVQSDTSSDTQSSISSPSPNVSE